MSHWFAIRTAPQREFALAGEHGILRKKGYEVFLPTETKKRKSIKKGRRFVYEVSYPMFTRYIFVREGFSWLELMAERHVSGVVGFEGQPAPIPDAEITRLKAMSGALIPHRRSVNPHKAVRKGEMAEITYGPYAGQVVKIEGLHGQKARVFLTLFGGAREVEIKLAQLEAA